LEAELAMIRPFDWRDLPLLHRVRHRGLCLDSQLAYTRGPNVLQFALLDMLNPGRAAHTFVSRPGGQAAIGQVVVPAGRSVAHIAFLSPAEILEDSHGSEMLDAMARAGAEHGAHSLIAEVDEHSPAFECLRRFGFAIYSRQRIWRPGVRRRPRRTGEPPRPRPGCFGGQPPKLTSWPSPACI
jgi:ribosomal protein S18 acetylase RimI-like enzyme